jgi:oligopeptidase A
MSTSPNNPLLTRDVGALPRFSDIRAEHIEPAIHSLLQAAQLALDTVTAPNFPADWREIAKVLDVSTERLSAAWGAVGHLQAVADTPELRAAYNQALPAVTEFWTSLGANQALYAKYKTINPQSLNPEQMAAHAHALRNFVLSGAELQGQDKTRFAEIQQRLAQLQQSFSEHVLDATQAFSYFANADELDGLPDDVLTSAREQAALEGKEGYKLSLKMPCYLPVMQFAKNRALRERLYRAHTTRASDQFEAADETLKGLDNSALMLEILELRHEEARLLGFESFAHLSLAPKMADTPEQVLSFLRDLAKRARPYAEQDLADMRAYAQAHMHLTDPQAWDWPFIAEQLRQNRYAYSEQEVKQYFTAPKVLQGLFEIIQDLFEVRIRADVAPTWHPSVQFFRIEREQTLNDGGKHWALVGQFYLDTEARSGKRGGAWADGMRSRWLRPDSAALQTPVAHLVCNFASGSGGKPALLSHDDVTTLFHEFGHGLHHMLTQVNERDVAGIHGVEWDAVELPSQFMENFCWEWDTVRRMSAHVDTGEALPFELFQKMLAAKNFQSGLQTLRQVEFSLFDMLIHTAEFQAKTQGKTSSPGVLPELASPILQTLDAVRSEVALLKPPAYNRMPHSFSHIFEGGYAAGYYSYKWAEVLSADAYAAFEECANPQDRARTGLRYRQTILEVGSSRSALESFKAFRGRAPQLDALLRHQGMAAETA